MSLSDALNVSVDAGSGAPPDTSAPVPSTPTGPAVPVDASAVQPDPGVPTPSTNVQDVGAVDNAAAQPLSPEDVAFQQDPQNVRLAKQGRLASMLRGMLMGLEGGRSPVASVVGGLAGAAAGAVAPNTISKDFANQQEDRQAVRQNRLANIKLSSARAALGILEAGRSRQMLDALPDPVTELHDQVAQQQIRDLQNAGQKPLVTQDAPGAMQALMQQMHDRFGSVPFASYIHQGGLLYAFPITNTDYDQYLKAAQSVGQHPVDANTFSKMSPEKQAELVNRVNTAFTVIPDHEHIDQVIQQVIADRHTYDANTPNWDSNKKSVLTKYDNYLTALRGASEFYDARHRQVMAQTAAARQRAEQNVAHTGQDQNGNWDSSSIPVMLVEGQMDPSQLSKRVSKGYSMNAVLEAASRYSQQKYGQPFSVAQATSDFKYATNPQTQNTLRMINGMTDAGGSLDIVANAAKNLPAVNSTVANKLFNIGSAQFGDPVLTNFHVAMLGLADEYSKVMGGGTSSDTGRQQALDILKDGYSNNQIAGAINILRSDIAARKAAIVGTNRYLQRQFGQKMAPGAQATPAPQQNAGNDPFAKFGGKKRQ